MCLNLFKRHPVWDADCGAAVEAAWLIPHLAAEAGVCLDPEPLEHNPQIQVDTATYDKESGLRVRCGFTGKLYRLRITAGEIQP